MPKNNEIPKTEDGARKVLVVAKKPVYCTDIICGNRHAKHSSGGVSVGLAAIHSKVKPLTISVHLPKQGIRTGTKGLAYNPLIE